MLIKYYLIMCSNKNPSSFLGDKEYIHIKAHVGGKQVIVITSEEIFNEDCIEKNKEEVQQILNQWIEEENNSPEKDIDGNDILQTDINIDKFIRK